MYKIATLFLIIFGSQITTAQIKVSSIASTYDTIFGGTSVYYQYAWDEPLDEDYPEIFKLSKPLKAFETIWDSAMVSDGSLSFVSSLHKDRLLIINGIGWDIIDKGWENDTLGLTNVSPIKISDSMDRVEWRSFGFARELVAIGELPSSGSVQIKINASNTVDIIFGDFAIARPDLCFEGFGSLRPSVSYFDEKDSIYTWFIYGDPKAPSIDTLSDTAFANLPVLGQKITLDFNKTNFIRKVSKLSVSVFPNPVAYNLTIHGLKDVSGSSFQIISMDGRTLSKGKLEKDQVNVEHLKTGNYILKLQYRGQVYYARFIKSEY